MRSTFTDRGYDAVSIPILEDYDISPITGFVPHSQPLVRLNQAYYQPWEEIMDQLNELMDTRQLRTRVDNMPVLQVNQLMTIREQQRAMVILCFMAHSYVWGQGLDIAQSIPESLAIPYQAIADVLDIAPTLTYATNNLWNWKLVDQNGPYTLDNLTVLHTMTGTYDEVWLDIVAIAIEFEAGATFKPLLEAIQAVREDDLLTVIQKLHVALPKLQNAVNALDRTFEKCDPAMFYWRIRKFFSGSENNAGMGLPDGLIYKGVDNDTPKQYMSATAGQTSILAALDIFFGVQHLEKPPPSSSLSTSPRSPSLNDEVEIKKEVPNTSARLQKLKQYMPGPHRAFLDHLAKVANLREYVLSKSTAKGSETELMVKELVQSYDACVHQIKSFRDAHIQIVTRYVLIQDRRGPPQGWEDFRVPVVVESEKPIKHYGTVTIAAAAPTNTYDEKIIVDHPMPSGIDLVMPFLKTNRNETLSAKIA
ncbi:hypothetical protein BGZ83_006915 [Gryganskiella cystojenkinii]|nr:hypothetical protein BGZ83_006915 [Gryganskiella cystojenkinii]